MPERSLEIYRKKHLGLSKKYLPDTDAGETTAGKSSLAVVVPVLDEFPSITKTIDSLCFSYQCYRDSPDFKDEQILLILVVNNRGSHSAAVKQNNQKTLDYFAVQLPLPAGFALKVLDCASAGRELPENQGVGLARKIGLDYGLIAGAAFFAWLDGDTLVKENYFQALFAFMRGKTDRRAALTDFSHQQTGILDQDVLVSAYENYLKNHSKKLQYALSPYYPVALGPTIVCSAEAYMAVGGMNTRLAGEDFYFLQSLIKVCPQPPEHLATQVYPSGRLSERVPFGTGKKVKNVLEGTDSIQEFPDWYYHSLRSFILLARELCQKAVQCDAPLCEDFARAIFEKDINLADFLRKEDFFSVWKKLFQNNRKSSARLETAFFGWFDGLKTIRLFHFFDDNQSTL